MKRKIPAPRNPYVAAAKFKKAGVHVKSKKARRRAAKMREAREVGAEVAQRPFPVSGLDSIPQSSNQREQSIDENDSGFVSAFDVHIQDEQRGDGSAYLRDVARPRRFDPCVRRSDS